MSPFGNRGLKGKELGLENPFVVCTVRVNLITLVEDTGSNYSQACAVGALQAASVSKEVLTLPGVDQVAAECELNVCAMDIKYQL